MAIALRDKVSVAGAESVRSGVGNEILERSWGIEKKETTLYNNYNIIIVIIILAEIVNNYNGIINHYVTPTLGSLRSHEQVRMTQLLL